MKFRNSDFYMCFLSIGLCWTDVSADNRNIYVKKLVNCRGFQNAPLQWSDITLERDSTTKDFTFSLKLKVLKEVSTKFAIEFNVWKCDSEGSLDSCEYFLKNYRNNHICTLMVQKNQFWSVFMERIVPRVECPIKKGVYKVEKCPFKSDFLKILPIREGYWKARLRGFDDNQPVSCVDLELKLVSGRSGSG